MSNPASLLPLLPLAIKNVHLINAERYISAVALAMLVYDYMLTFDDEVRYIWRRPVSSVKILYVILRYGVAVTQIVYFQAYAYVPKPSLNRPQLCVGAMLVVAIAGSMALVLANYIMLIRVYTLWDHRKRMLQTLHVAYFISVCSTIAFVAASIVQLLPHMVYDPFIFRMCLIAGRTPYWIGIWLSQALFDVFLFILTIFNAASRPRRANVKIITDLRRDGCLFYLGLFFGRFLNIALSIPSDKEYYLIAVPFVLSLTTVTVTRLVLRVERLLVTRGGSRDIRPTDWVFNSYELQTSY
ncbi:hypothetical protein F5148DRAFT_1339376 [Russula earlei]|uniref:Uncharacterized protein n=1 Tax=Russula earlei TaxID=71964 RepID=A0ACC0UGA2_9AGAM|nr:hypothetical protein F5148DRAFT_1339376 [Russula earlei]